MLEINCNYISRRSRAVCLSVVRDIQRVSGRVYTLGTPGRSSGTGTCEGIDVVCIHMHASIPGLRRAMCVYTLL